MRKTFLIFGLLLCGIVAKSQLVEVGLLSNPVIEKYARTHQFKTLRSGTDTLELPFFDDFAKPLVYPDTNLWEDNFVFVNQSFGDNPPSVGVATLDMLNQTGEIYNTASNMGFEADKLTSIPINLDYPNDTTIFLSFYYQPQGLSGNAPEYQDSLILQFTSPDTVWATVWSVAGSDNQAFRQVIIPIDNPMYLKKGFQFRFINYGSIADNSVASWAGNGDVWNLDFVYLDKNRTETDTTYDEVAFVNNITSFLNNYESIPWTHYDASQNHFDFDYEIKNLRNNNGNIQVKSRTLDMIDSFSGNGVNQSFGAENIPDNATSSFTSTLVITGALFHSNSSDSADFKTRFFLEVDTISEHQKFRWNDTLEYHQQFSNYYAYDDGIPEAGIGLFGNGTAHAKLAYRFDPIVPDTLRAVKIFFNRTYQDASQKYFIFTVWSDNNGLPDTVIYSEIGMRPEYADSLNQFTLYTPDTLMYLTGPFFIGWEKTTEDMLNVGFDKNRDSHNKVFYNIYGSWQASTIPGAMMIRPVFGKDFTSNIPSTPQSEQFNVLLYPNPVRDKLFLQFSGAHTNTGFSTTVLNLYGKTVCSFPNVPNEIATTELFAGIYLLAIRDENGRIVSQKKFIVVR
ncbi:MAG: T9SS type A sorting domain-containing protein [Bacteroidales bacterium]|nr:T9SS type A sorting domain-containing protein [Bacteroidales bacterium]